MPCLITTGSANEQTTREKQQKKQKQKLLGTAKTQYINLQAPSNNVKLQSDKTLTTHVYFFLNTHQIGFFLNETR